MQSRDPFSGDCDRRLGVATSTCEGDTLQSRDLFSGDCDCLHLRRQEPHPVSKHLQSRDPFSGDCDGAFRVTRTVISVPGLQSRDPFSGDCDGRPCYTWRCTGPSKCLAEPRPVLRGLRRAPGPGAPRPAARLLAEPRPVLRGLRPGWRRKRCRAPRQLAEPRPVLRGLRPHLHNPAPDPEGPEACRAETRSQGIATERKSKRGSWLQYLFPGDCNATLDTSGNLHYTWGKRGGLPATRRPVCRGLRHYKG